MKKLLLIFTGLLLIAQDASVRRFTVYRESVLAAAAETVTVYKIGGNSTAQMVDAAISCSVTCTVTLEINGTNSGGTGITPTPMRSNWAASTISAAYGTTVTGSSVVGKYEIAAGVSPLAIDLNGAYISEVGDDITLRVSAITGTARFWFRYIERN